MFMSKFRAHVRGQQDEVFLKSMAAFAVFHHALVEHLEEDLVHVRVGLFHLVQQHDAE
jgi:hypothetical protein